MFGFFKSKKKQEAAKRAEKHDSFYRETEEDEDDFVDDQGMDDEEYGRRVTEEIAKRKSAAKSSPSVSSAHSPASRGHTTPTSRATNSPVTTPPPSVATSHAAKVTTTSVSSHINSKMKSVPVVTATVVPNPKKQTAAARPNPATAAPIIPGINSTKSNPTTPTASNISASRPYAATSAPIIANPSRPHTATTPPLHIAAVAGRSTPRGGFIPDPKLIQQLVTMGFSYPAASMALRVKENRADQAAEYLLEHTDAEINSLLAIESAQKANAAKKADAATHPAASKTSTSSASIAVSSSNVTANNTSTSSTSSHTIDDVSLKRGASSKDINKTNSAASSGTSSIAQNTSLERKNSKKNVVAKEVSAVDAAMAAVIAKREALKKKQAQVLKQSSQKNIKASSTEETTTTTSTAASSTAVYDKLSNYKTKGTVAREQQEEEEEDRLRVEGQEKRRKTLSAPAGTDSTASAVVSTDSTSPAHDDNHTGTGSTSTTTPVGEKERNSRQANTSPRRSNSSAGRAEEGKASRKSDTSPRRTSSGSTSTAGSAFEALYNKKTERMLLIEQLEAEERAEKEAQERKWKKLITKTEHTTTTADSSDHELEVFDKLYSKSIESQKSREKALLEEKLHKEKLEAHISGKAGIALQSNENMNILKKTESARMREYETMEERKRFEEEERRKKELEPTPMMSPSRPPMSRRSSSVDRLQLSSEDGMIRRSSSVDRLRLSSDDRSEASMVRRLSSSLDSISMVEVQEEEESDTETPAIQQSPNPAVKEHSPVKTHSSELNNNIPTENIPNHSSILSHIPGVIKRTRMNSKVVERSDHRWEGKVNVPSKEAALMVPIKGSYASKQQCVLLTTAYTPPVWKVQTKLSFCSICEESFNKYLRAENCRNCGQLVCPDCSDETSWPNTMLPNTFYEKNCMNIRICSACIKTANTFITALKTGDFDTVQSVYKHGNVNLHQPYSILPEAPYPIHCAAASGNVTLLRWLVEDQGCCITDPSTGAPLVNRSGHTILAVAARRGDRDMMLYATRDLHCSTADITDVAILQRGLHAALEASGALPSLTLKKHTTQPTSNTTATPVVAISTSASIAAASALNLRRVENLPVSAPAAVPQPATTTDASTEEPVTESLLLKAAEITSRLRAAPLSRAPSAAISTTTTATTTRDTGSVSTATVVKKSGQSKASLSKTKSSSSRKSTASADKAITGRVHSGVVPVPAAETRSAASEVSITNRNDDVKDTVDQDSAETVLAHSKKGVAADSLKETPIVDATADAQASPPAQNAVVEAQTKTEEVVDVDALAETEEAAVVDGPAETEEAVDAPAEVVDAPAEVEEVVDVPAESVDVVDAPTETEEAVDAPAEVVDAPSETEMVVHRPAQVEEAVNAPAETEVAVDAPAEVEEVVDAPAETEEALDAPAAAVEVVDAPAEVVNAPSETEVAVDAPAEAVEVVNAPAETEEAVDAPAEVVDAPSETEVAVDAPAAAVEVVDAPAEAVVVDAPAETEEAVDVPAETEEAVDAPAETEEALDAPTEIEETSMVGIKAAVDTEVEGVAEYLDEPVLISESELEVDSELESASEEDQGDHGAIPPSVGEELLETAAGDEIVQREGASTTVPTATDTTRADTAASKNLADTPTVRVAPSVPKNKTFITGTRRMSSTKMEPPEEIPSARMSMPGGSRTNSWRVDNTNTNSNGSSGSGKT